MNILSLKRCMAAALLLLPVPALRAQALPGGEHSATPPLLLRPPGQEAEAPDPHAGHDHGREEALLVLSEGVMKGMGIEVAQAGPMVLGQHLVLPGEVHVNDDRLAHIVPRYPGLVTEVRKHMGDRVERGEVLAVLESNESLATYELKSMITGTVIDKHITIGENVGDDHAVYTVADLGTVWVDLTVFQRDLASVQPGQRVMVISDSGTASGTVGYISPTLRPDTRTALARVVLDNRGAQWKPGMFVTARLDLGETAVRVAVPDHAVQMLDGEPVIFVPRGEGFTPTPVRTGRKSLGKIEILDGLHAGEPFVAHGAFHLKAEIVTSGLDPHAGHGH